MENFLGAVPVDILQCLFGENSEGSPRKISIGVRGAIAERMAKGFLEDFFVEIYVETHEKITKGFLGGLSG